MRLHFVHLFHRSSGNGPRRPNWFRRAAFFLSLLIPVLAVNAEGLPDLRFGSPSLYLEATQATLVVPVENEGSAATPGRVEVRLGQRDTPDEDWVWETLRLDPLPAGGRIPLKLGFPLTASQAALAVTITLDPANNLAEENEENNTLVRGSVSLLVPPPQLDPVPPACGGETVVIKGQYRYGMGGRVPGRR